MLRSHAVPYRFSRAVGGAHVRPLVVQPFAAEGLIGKGDAAVYRYCE